jgi:hypothetical protein
VRGHALHRAILGKQHAAVAERKGGRVAQPSRAGDMGAGI